MTHGARTGSSTDDMPLEGWCWCYGIAILDTYHTILNLKMIRIYYSLHGMAVTVQ